MDMTGFWSRLLALSPLGICGVGHLNEKLQKKYETASEETHGPVSAFYVYVHEGGLYFYGDTPIEALERAETCLRR